MPVQGTNLKVVAVPILPRRGQGDAGRRSPLDALLRRPAAAVVAGFAVAVAIGTVAVDAAGGDRGRRRGRVGDGAVHHGLLGVRHRVDRRGHPDLLVAFGELAILSMIQIGGIGIMTLATLLGLLIARRVGLRLQLTAQAETKALGLGEVRQVVVRHAGDQCDHRAADGGAAGGAVRRVLRRAARAGALSGVVPRGVGVQQRRVRAVHRQHDPVRHRPVDLFAAGPGHDPGWASGSRCCSSSADTCAAEWSRWSLHLRVTVGTYAILFVVGVAAFLLGEWTNPGTLGPVDVGGKLVIGVFSGIQPRTAGFNSVDIGQLDPATLLITDVLMFIGGGSAGTAGGIKVTTFALLAFVMLGRGPRRTHRACARAPAAAGDPAAGIDRRAGRGRAGHGVHGDPAGNHPLRAGRGAVRDRVRVRHRRAVHRDHRRPARRGPVAAGALMFLGRLGPITLASALALREHERRYELPEERTIVG